MGVSYEYQNDGRIVFARYRGAITSAEIAALYRSYCADPAFRFERPHLADMSELESGDAGFAEIFSVFSLFSRSYAPTGAILRIALYIPSEQATFGLARIFQNLAESTEVMEVAIFDDLEDARAWALSAASDMPPPPRSAPPRAGGGQCAHL